MRQKSRLSPICWKLTVTLCRTKTLNVSITNNKSNFKILSKNIVFLPSPESSLKKHFLPCWRQKRLFQKIWRKSMRLLHNPSPPDHTFAHPPSVPFSLALLEPLSTHNHPPAQTKHLQAATIYRNITRKAFQPFYLTLRNQMYIEQSWHTVLSLSLLQAHVPLAYRFSHMHIIYKNVFLISLLFFAQEICNIHAL